MSILRTLFVVTLISQKNVTMFMFICTHVAIYARSLKVTSLQFRASGSTVLCVITLVVEVFWKRS